MNTFKAKLLLKIDRCCSYSEKLEVLNDAFLKAKTKEHEEIVLDFINSLKFFGK